MPLNKETKPNQPIAYSAGEEAVEYAEYTPNECSRYDTDLSNDEAPVLELWGMWRTSSLLLLPGPL